MLRTCDSMATRYWKARDGLKIPHHLDPVRKDWDDGYYNILVKQFGLDNPGRLKPVMVPVGPESMSHYVGDTGMRAGRNRAPFYQRMLAGGDHLPPLVVKRNGQGWTIVDGNARMKAAIAHARTPELQAYEMVEPPTVSPDKTKLNKTETPYTPEDLSDGIQYLGDGGDFDTSQTPAFHGIVHMHPADFVDDASHLGREKAGWLRKFPASTWADQLRSEYDRDFTHIVAAHNTQSMKPGIQIDGRMGDGRGRAMFHHAIGSRMPVAVFLTRTPND